MKKDHTKLLAILLSTLAIIVVVISMFFNKKEAKSNEILIVKNPSNFFTVNSCLYRVTTYISNKDTESLLKTLDKSYKRKNKINTNNILSLFPSIDKNVTFISKKMYYEEINSSLTKYYVYGIIQSNIIHDYTEVQKEDSVDVYLIVNMDSKNQTFSIEPYNGEIFMDGEKNE